MNHSLAAYKMGLRAIIFSAHQNGDGIEEERREKTENNAVTPFIIGTALTNMMNETKMECVRRTYLSRMRGWNFNKFLPNHKSAFGKIFLILIITHQMGAH